MRLIVSGSRNCNDYKLISSMLDAYIRSQKPSTVEIVSGGQRGVDTIAKEYATRNGYKHTEFKADWDKHGYSAGPIRNHEMAKYGTHCIIFTEDGPGSKNMENVARKHKIEPIVISV